MRRLKRASRVLSLLSIVVPSLVAAGILYTLESPNAASESGSFGRCVAGAGDVNLDTYADVIVGAPYEDGGADRAGRAYVFSGAGGDLLYTLESGCPDPFGHFGGSVSSAGDVNNDGCSDVVVGAAGEKMLAPNAGRAYVFSGADGTLLYALESPNPQFEGFFGGSVSCAGDVDRDGLDDVIVGAEQEDGPAARAGRAYVFGGDGGHLLYTLDSPNPEYLGYFGRSVSWAGDVNNDTYPDFIVGADWEDGVAGNDGKAYVFSGSDGSLLHAFASPNSGSGGQFGCSVSCAGWANGDEYADVIVGAYKEYASAQWAGRAYVFDGNSGDLLYALESPNTQYWGYFGRSVSGAGDVDSDGFDDVVVGAGAEDGDVAGSGFAYLFSGNEGVLLHTLESPWPETHGAFGHSVSSAGDVNNDAYADVVIGACCEDGGGLDAGRAYVFDLTLETLLLSGTLSGNGLELQWAPFPGTANYWVFGACDEPFFVPGPKPDYEHRLVVLDPQTTTWASPNGIADPNANWAYLVTAVDETASEITRSNRVGEFDFDTVFP
jgi:hypothetical protein